MFNRSKDIYLYPRIKPKHKTNKKIKVFLLTLLVLFVVLVVYLYSVTGILNKPIQEPTRLIAQGVEFSLGEFVSKKSLKLILKQYHLKKTKRKYPKVGYFSQRNNQFILKFKDEVFKISLKKNQIYFLSKNNQSLKKITLPKVTIGILADNEFKDYQPLLLTQYPKKLIDMLLSIEDARFYEHEGVDFFSLYSAIYDTFFKDKALRGASTITQQLIKNIVLSNERTFTRKIQEFFLAFMLELRFDKKTILERYLNTVYFAQDGKRAVHGFALASEYYFNQSINNLSDDKLALLVAMTKGAFAYHPKYKPKQAKKRRNLVLRIWNKSQKKSKWIGNLLKKPLGIVNKQTYQHYASAVDLVRQELKMFYPDLKLDNLKIYLNLDIKLQHLLQKKIHKVLTKIEKNRQNAKSLQSAMIVADKKSGKIKAILGDRFNREGVFNRALSASRQIGSLIKPIIYFSALVKSEQYNLLSVLKDEKVEKGYLQLSQDDFKVLKDKLWQPKNYDKKQHGNVYLMDALAKSYNVPTVKLGLDIGLKEVIKTLQKTGLNKDIQYLPSVLLGALNLTPLEVLGIYQSLMGDGFVLKPKIIEVIEQNGKLIKIEKKQKKSFEVKNLNLLKFALLQTTQIGTARGLKKEFKQLNIAAKTGTSDEYRDSWFVAIGDEYSVVTWVGRDDNKPIFLSGSSGAMRVFSTVFKDNGFINLSLIEDENFNLLHLSKEESCQDTLYVPFIINENTYQTLQKEGWFICQNN